MWKLIKYPVIYLRLKRQTPGSTKRYITLQVNFIRTWVIYVGILYESRCHFEAKQPGRTQHSVLYGKYYILWRALCMWLFSRKIYVIMMMNKDIACGKWIIFWHVPYTVRYGYKAVNRVTNIHKRLARYGEVWGVFWDPASDWYSAWVPAVMYAISNYILLDRVVRALDRMWVFSVRNHLE